MTEPCYVTEWVVAQPASWEDMASRPRPTRFRRSNSFSSWESLQSVSTAGDVIRQAGYPLEEHTVTTSDGYVLQMERMPRRGDCSSGLNNVVALNMTHLFSFLKPEHIF